MRKHPQPHGLNSEFYDLTTGLPVENLTWLNKIDGKSPYQTEYKHTEWNVSTSFFICSTSQRIPLWMRTSENSCGQWSAKWFALVSMAAKTPSAATATGGTASCSNQPTGRNFATRQAAWSPSKSERQTVLTPSSSSTSAARFVAAIKTSVRTIWWSRLTKSATSCR